VLAWHWAPGSKSYETDERAAFQGSGRRWNSEAEQAEQLWDRLSTATEGQQEFDPLQVAYYFGGVIIVGAMTFFFSLAWERVGGVGILALALTYGCLFGVLGPHLFHARKLYVAGGLLTAVAVCMTPLAVYGFERAMGWWPQADPGSYQNYHVWERHAGCSWNWLTLAAGGVALRFVRFPFLTAPIAAALWYMSLDLTPLLFGKTRLQRAPATLGVGGIRRRCPGGSLPGGPAHHEEYAFWLYLIRAGGFLGRALLDGQRRPLVQVGVFCHQSSADRGIFPAGSQGLRGVRLSSVWRAT
jgi:hypothetical protein